MVLYITYAPRLPCQANHIAGLKLLVNIDATRHNRTARRLGNVAHRSIFVGIEVDITNVSCKYVERASPCTHAIVYIAPYSLQRGSTHQNVKSQENHLSQRFEIFRRGKASVNCYFYLIS